MEVEATDEEEDIMDVVDYINEGIFIHLEDNFVVMDPIMDIIIIMFL
jgi:hypothetical protein